MARSDHSLTGLLGALAAALLAGACSLLPGERPAPAASPATVPSPATAPAPPSNAPPAPAAQPPQPAREIRLSAATRSLVDQARVQAAHGDLPAASFTLDRALRIEPNNALLWIELGQLRLSERDPHQAEGCARKALALASGDPMAQARSRKLLVDALREAQRRPVMN